MGWAWNLILVSLLLLSVGLGFLGKSPIPALFLLLSLLAYRSVRSHSPYWFDWKGHLIGLSVLLIIAVPWVLAVIPATHVDSAVSFRFCPKWLEFLFTKGGDGLPQTHYLALAEWIKQFFGRMQGFDHIKPWYYFLVILAKKGYRKHAGLALLPVWLLTALVLFSLPASKKSYYILPLYPALALTAAWFLEELRNRRLTNHWSETTTLWILRFCAGLFIVLGPTLLFLSGLVDARLPKYQGHPVQLALAAALFLLSGWGIIWATLQRRWLATFTILSVATILGFGIHTSLLPSLNAHKGDRLLCEGLERAVEIRDSDDILTYDMSNQPIFRYYFNRHVSEVNTPENLLKRLEERHADRRILLAMESKDFQGITFFSGTSEEQHTLLNQALTDLKAASPRREVNWHSAARSKDGEWRVILEARPRMPKKERDRRRTELEERIRTYSKKTKAIGERLAELGGTARPIHTFFQSIHPAEGTDCLWLITK
jgi:hypothetical protein